MLTGCLEDSVDGTYWNVTPIVPDTTIYLASLPADVHLRLGKSVSIQNCNTIFRFSELLEYGRENSAVQMEVEYNVADVKSIVLNTNTIPGDYELENGMNYSITLKEVSRVDTTFQLTFVFNEYAYW